MAVPNSRTPELALDAEGNHTTTSHYLTTGGNQTGSVPTQHGSDGEEVNLDYYLPLYCAASSGNWEEASKFLDNDPHAAKARISNLSMTALHVAASEGHSEFVEKLVKRVPRDVLEMQDEMGFTPLHYAAIGGSLRSAKALLMENLKLAQCVDAEGRTPLLLAATFASENKELVWYFLLVTTNEEPGHPFTGHWAANLVNMLIASGFHEISLYVLNKYPELAIAKDKEDCTALYVLARNQSNFLSGSRLGFWESCIYSFLPVEVDSILPQSVRSYVANTRTVWRGETGYVTPKGIVWYQSAIFNTSCVILFSVAVLHGLRRVLFGAIKRIAPASFTQLHDAKLRHHCAVELVKRICSQLSQRHTSWRFNYLLNSDIMQIATVNGIVEIITKLAPLPQLSSISGAALQMQRELQWFKEVEKLVHPYYKESRNQNRESARELFTKEHKLLAESGEKWLKDTSNSCMLVSTLVATVVFAAAFTVPGGNDNEGAPIFLQKKSAIFLVFVVSDTVALFSSLTSLLMFLSILTARYAEEDFLESLPKRLIIGLGTLFFAIAATMVAFGATLSIVLSKRFNGVSVPITLLASFPVTLFALLQLPLFIQMVRSTFGQSIFRPKKLG
ncbi:hypothetical protein ACFX13_018364 [Malus domestica]